MGIKVDVRGDMGKIIADLRSVRRDVLDAALPAAINKTIEQAKNQTARQIKAVGYNLKIGDVKDGLTVRPARSGQLTAKITAKGRPLSLVKYGARQTARGVSVSVLNGRKVIAGAFIATMPNGHRGVYVRMGKAHKKVSKNGRTQWSGLPIKELYGPSIPDAANNQAVVDAVTAFIGQKFPELLRAQIKRFGRKG
jgi:hypothetical protein